MTEARSPGRRADLVAVDRAGNARPQGEVSTLRLQARAGFFELLPSPHDFILLRRDGGTRNVTMGGEVRSAGILCDVVSFIGHCGWRGELVVFQEMEHRSLWFDQGHVVGGRSSVVRERLGEVLYRHGVLTRDQVEKCSDATIGGRLRFGEAAVKLGFVTREQLFRLMGRQIEEIAYGTLLVDQGTYWFLDSFEESELAALEKLPVGNLVREGVRRMHESRFFRTRIPSERHVPVHATGRSKPDNDPLKIWGAVDGERSIADLCRALGQGDFEVTRAVFQLVQSGHIAIRPPRVVAREAVRIFNEAISIVLRELDAFDEGDDVREGLAAFVSQRPLLTELLSHAGPSDDGTIDAVKVEENVMATKEPRRQEELLGQSLYEYARYALFLAKPHLDRVQPTPSKRRVSLQVNAVLEPIAPEKPRRG
jgi:hypothetical protein